MEKGLRRSRLAASILAILFGVLGTFAGISGALTFVPYHAQNHQDLATGQTLAVISAIGAAVSLAGIAAGYWLLREKGWAWPATLGAALGCVATVAVFAALMPSATPSPVPGGPGVFVFLGVVAAAYGVETIFLVQNRWLGTVVRRGGVSI